MFPPRINNIIRKTQSWNEDRRELSQLVLSIIKYLHQENKRNTNQCHLGNEVVIGRIGHGVPVYWGTDLRSVFRNMRPTTNSDWIDSIQYFNLPKIKTKTIWYKFDTKVSDSNNSEKNKCILLLYNSVLSPQRELWFTVCITQKTECFSANCSLIFKPVHLIILVL